MEGYFTIEGASARMDMPVFLMEKMIADGEIRTSDFGGEILVSEFELSLQPGFPMLAPTLDHAQSLLAKCEEGPP